MRETLNASICIWCANKMVDVCFERCQAEGRYRYLVPEHLADWELPPELPPFRELIELPAIERLALVYLAACYERQRLTKE